MEIKVSMPKNKIIHVMGKDLAALLESDDSYLSFSGIALYADVTHMDPIKDTQIQEELSKSQIAIVYENEAVLLNAALFDITAMLWRETNPDSRGNKSDDAALELLIKLSNLESIRAVFSN